MNSLVEILIGSTIRPEFYKKGENIFGDKICDIDNYVIKDFWITPCDSIEQMKEKNRDKIKIFKKVINVFTFDRNNKVIIGFDTGDEKATFIDSKRILSQTKLEITQIEVLKGSYICPEYFKEGDILPDGTNCRKSGAIIKTLNLRYSGTIKEMLEKHNDYIATENLRNHSSREFSESQDYTFRDYERDTFYAMTDGMFGSYENFLNNGEDLNDFLEGHGY